jgi:repressor LexA
MATNPSTRSTELTTRQAEVLKVIQQHIEDTGAPPTRAEIAKTLGFKSVNAAEDHLKALAKKGAIFLSPGTSRGIKLKASLSNAGAGFPVLNQLKVDQPILSPENFEGRLQLEQTLFQVKPDFLWRMQGNFLSGAGIYNNDLVAFHCSNHAEDNQIIFCRYNQEAYVRRLKKEGADYVLTGEDPHCQPIRVTPSQQSQFIIEAVAVGIIRTNFKSQVD